MCWCTVLPGISRAIPDTHRCLWERERENSAPLWAGVSVSIPRGDLKNKKRHNSMLLQPSKMTVMGFGLKPSPPGHRVLYWAVTQNTETNYKPASRVCVIAEFASNCDESWCLKKPFLVMHLFPFVFCRAFCDLSVSHRAQRTGHDCSYSELQSEKKKVLFLSQKQTVPWAEKDESFPVMFWNICWQFPNKLHKAVSFLPATAITANTLIAWQEKPACESACKQSS